VISGFVGWRERDEVFGEIIGSMDFLETSKD
jgi:hypothetical protein